eukprot:CAMPEP_0179045334 /NCGR_PEP_ID=MMETSP0796-20121207/18124_1 /TAXON_ID=73915 /ORGANISM="Pyrodinium bahamense, Strain pbaha01" /LENGTH=792 /DNA_ID=CAMNT_0020741737 /DNA_START=80 /DNA_END=2455 /DNA_ORIENTATION=+
MRGSECFCVPFPSIGRARPRQGHTGAQSIESVILRVGEHTVSTTRETLAKCPRLADLVRSEGDAYCLDHDGTYISEILNFLRDGPELFTAPLEKEDRLGLLREAIFFDLPDLAACVRDAHCGAPLPANETERLKRLKELQIMDTDEHEYRYDCITRIVAAITSAPVALLSFVDEDREWIKSRYGFEANSTPRDCSFCAFHFEKEDPECANVLIIEDARSDPRVASNPLVVGEPHIAFYAGCPLVTSDGIRLGALSVQDFVPRTLSGLQEQVLVNMATLAMQEVERIQLLDSCVDEDEADPGYIPRTSDFAAGRLRRERMREALGEAVCLVRVRMDSLHWPILYANFIWSNISGIRITPPDSLAGKAVASGNGLRFVPMAADRELGLWDWLRLTEKDQQQLRRKLSVESEQPRASFAISATVPAFVAGGAGYIARGAGADRIPVTCRFVPCELPLDVTAGAIVATDTQQRPRVAPTGADAESLYFAKIVVDREVEPEGPRSNVSSASSTPEPGGRRAILGGAMRGSMLGRTLTSEVPHMRDLRPTKVFMAVRPCTPFLNVRLVRKVSSGPNLKVYYAAWMGSPVVVHRLESPVNPNMETWIVQEWCDGSYATPKAAASGAGHAPGPRERLRGEEDHGRLPVNAVLVKTEVSAKGYVCKLCDLSLARYLEGNRVDMVDAAASAYGLSATELSNQRRFIAKADPYAAGLLLWQAVKGVSPCPGLSAQEFLMKALLGSRPFELASDTPQEIRDVLAGCEAEAPEDWPTFSQLVELVLNLQSRSGGAAGAEEEDGEG